MSNDIGLVPRIINGIKQAQASDKTPAFAYVRVSSDKQEDGNSLEYQEKKAKEYVLVNLRWYISRKRLFLSGLMKKLNGYDILMK